MILLEGDLVIIKLRLPDRKQHLSRKDGYRLIYLVGCPVCRTKNALD